MACMSDTSQRIAIVCEGRLHRRAVPRIARSPHPRRFPVVGLVGARQVGKRGQTLTVVSGFVPARDTLINDAAGGRSVHCSTSSLSLDWSAPGRSARRLSPAISINDAQRSRSSSTWKIPPTKGGWPIPSWHSSHCGVWSSSTKSNAARGCSASCGCWWTGPATRLGSWYWEAPAPICCGSPPRPWRDESPTTNFLHSGSAKPGPELTLY